MGASLLEFEGGAYEFVGELGGRGQKVVAGTGIYQKCGTKEKFIVKFDPPGTCLGETMVVVPESSARSEAIVAGKLGVDPVSKRPFSIQPFVRPKEGEYFRKFDVLALGKPRWAKNPIASDEYFYKDHIRETLKTMTSAAKKQFAEAIYLSQINGDESLHTGQFVCSENSDGLITKITRIDLGAIGRYAVYRAMTGDFHLFQTSERYAASGQAKKDYVGFYVDKRNGNPAIKAELYRLWTATKPNEIAEGVQKKFQEQVKKLGSDPDAKYNAVFEFNKTLIRVSRIRVLSEKQGMSPNVFKKLPPAEKDKVLNEFIQKVEDSLVGSTYARCNTMKIGAELEYRKHMEYALGKVEKFANSNKPPQEKRQLLLGALKKTGSLPLINRAEYLVRLDETFDQVNALPDSDPLKNQIKIQLKQITSETDNKAKIVNALVTLDSIQEFCTIKKQHAKAKEYLVTVLDFLKTKDAPQEKKLLSFFKSASSKTLTKQKHDENIAMMSAKRSLLVVALKEPTKDEIMHAEYVKKVETVFELVYSKSLPLSKEAIAWMKEELSTIVYQGGYQALEKLEELQKFRDLAVQQDKAQAESRQSMGSESKGSYSNIRDSDSSSLPLSPSSSSPPSSPKSRSSNSGDDEDAGLGSGGPGTYPR